MSKQYKGYVAIRDNFSFYDLHSDNILKSQSNGLYFKV